MTEYTPEKVAELVADLRARAGVAVTHEATDALNAAADALAAVSDDRDAYKRAKAENDERFMIERDEARAERDKAIATGERILADALKVSAERDELLAVITEALDEFERLEEACVAVPSKKFFLRILRAALDKEGSDDE